jgi:hypothetical protein
MFASQDEAEKEFLRVKTELDQIRRLLTPRFLGELELPSQGVKAALDAVYRLEHDHAKDRTAEVQRSLDAEIRNNEGLGEELVALRSKFRTVRRLLGIARAVAKEEGDS